MYPMEVGSEFCNHDAQVAVCNNTGAPLWAAKVRRKMPSTANLWCATFQRVDDLYAAALASVGWQSPSQKYVGSKAKER